MNIKQLRYVCSIVDAGSFSAAAAREGVSVQAVSKSMAELEGRLGAPLFERQSSGVRPTPFCRAFARQARRVLTEWDSLERFALSGGREGATDATRFQMGFCCPSFPGVEKFSALISIVSRKALGREVEVTLLAGSEALDALRSGRVDSLITIGSLSAEDITCGSLGTVASGLFMAADHPLTRLEQVSLADIKDNPVLVSEHFDHFNESVLNAYLARGLKARLVSVGTPEEFVSFYANQGVSFIVAGNLITPDAGFAIRPIVKSDEVAIPICLSTLRGAGGVDFMAYRRALTNLHVL